MNISFGTKAETLEILRPLVKKCFVLDQVRFTVKEWIENSELQLKRIKKRYGLKENKIIIRSASITEDTENDSQAGKFKSVLDINVNDKLKVRHSIDKVIESFGEQNSDNNQIFVQQMVGNAIMSGVAFTRDLESLAPYYVINYDNTTNKTDTVTSGNSNNLNTVIKFRNHDTKISELKNLFKAIEEIEHFFQSDKLDIEFAINNKKEVIILQVRQLTVDPNNRLYTTDEIGHYLNKISKKVEKSNKQKHNLFGNTTIFGVMPDWNPAEMIGIKPKQLALSLYKELITDRTWAYQRRKYGYKDVRSHPLLYTLIGHPYVDVRTSVNSFIPHTLNPETSDKLCQFYLSQLSSHPGNHDKIEFEIIFSCYHLTLKQKLKKLLQFNFNKDDIDNIKNSLVDLTNDIINLENGVFLDDIQNVKILKEKQKQLLLSDSTLIEKIFWLTEDCKRYGTLPFAGLARAGFIAVQILNSLVDSYCILNTEKEKFLGSITTVAKELNKDQSELSKADFIEKYGHLRPGTYDLNSKSYAEAYDIYFSKKTGKKFTTKEFQFNSRCLKKIDTVLKLEGLKFNSVQLLHFIEVAIQQREYAKYVFTISVSNILNLTKQLCGEYNIEPDDAAYLDVRTLLQLYSNLDHRDLHDILGEEVKRNKHYYEYTKVIKLPTLITNSSEVYEFRVELGQPNYITLLKCEALVVLEDELNHAELNNKIVLISRADPGYDWVFTKQIAGLITMYGGANSHMAIRAAELQIPAVIGAGSKFFNEWATATTLIIDCSNKIVTKIN